LVLLSRDVSLRAKRQNLWGRTVTLKIKFSNMKGITRAASGDAVNSAKEIYERAKKLLSKEKLELSVRLVGVSLSNMQEFPDECGRQLSLFDAEEHKTEQDVQRTQALEDTIFDLHNKYGRNILKTGKELEIQQKINNIKNKTM